MRLHPRKQKATLRSTPYSLIILFTCATSLITAQQLPIISTSAPASARTRTKWYILGGSTSTVENAPPSSQFISIDLAVHWLTALPAWSRLTNTGTPSQALFPATFSSDEKNMFVYHLPGDPRVGQYNVDQDAWVASGMQFPAYDVQGIVAVTDPTTGYIYLTGGYTKYIDGRVSFVDKYHPSRPTESVTFIPYPATGFVSRRYVGNVFCKPWGGILYFGGYNFENKLIAEANVITLLDVSTNSFSTLPTTGPTPENRADHCMAINDDGSKVVVYGGRLASGFTGTIYILDTKTLEWTQGKTGDPRSYTACIIAGEQLIVWGGKYAGTPELVAKDPVLVYDIPSREWVTTYTPPASYQSGNGGSTNTTTGGAGGSSGSGGIALPTGTENLDNKPSSNTGAIVGGVLGALAVITAIVGLLFWRRRKQQTQYQTGARGGKKKPFIVKPPLSLSPTSDPEEQKALDSGDYIAVNSTAAMGHTNTTNIAGTSPKNPKTPQGVVQLDADLERSMRDLEYQQKQLDLKRQILALQQEEQYLRSSLPMANGMSQQQSPSLFQQPLQALHGGAFGSQAQGYERPSSGYEYQLQPGVYQSYPTPPPVTTFSSSPTAKQTVHTAPKPFSPEIPAATAPATSATSEMFQDSTEPTYAPIAPEAAPRWLPGLEYQEGMTHNGVGWVRSKNAPHAVVGGGGSEKRQ